MRAAYRRRLGAALTISILSTALVAGCRSRARGTALVAAAPVGREGTAPVAPATQIAPKSGDADSRIRGLILDELGPPPAATVYVLRWKGDPGEEGPVTDAVSIVTANASGEFAFDLTSAASKALRIDVAGLAPRRVWLPEDTPRSPILMLGTRTLQGLVCDPDGRPVEGALVRVFIWPEKGDHGSGGTGHQIRDRTRSDGAYHVDRLPGGRCRITVEGRTSEGETWFEEEYRSFAEPEAVARVDLGSSARQPRVTVRVRAAPGGVPRRLLTLVFRPAAGRRRTAAENADGTYAVRLPPGSYEALMSVAVERDGVCREGEAPLNGADGRPAIVEVRAGAPDPTFDLYLPAK
jgi:hypothetical protein